VAGKKGVRLKPAGQTQQERDRISLGRIESYMDAVIVGHFQCPTCQEKAEIKDISSSAVTLIKARYDKLRPSLSAIEQTNVNPDDKLDDSALLDRFKALIAANPELLNLVTQSSNNASITPCADAQTGVNTVTH
jgi:hypothetical protein